MITTLKENWISAEKKNMNREEKNDKCHKLINNISTSFYVWIEKKKKELNICQNVDFLYCYPNCTDGCCCCCCPGRGLLSLVKLNLALSIALIRGSIGGFGVAAVGIVGIACGGYVINGKLYGKPWPFTRWCTQWESTN